MNIFLTGHRGFIGSVVHKQFPDASLLDKKNPTTEELQAMLKGKDCIIHLAGGGGAKFCVQYPKEALENNILLTYRLVQAAKKANVKHFIFASSIAVYGTIKSPQNPLVETQIPMPDDLYGSLKWSCEELVKEVPYTILRFANVYGFGTGTHMHKGGFINNACLSAKSTKKITLTSSTLSMDFVHVNDAAHAIQLCVFSEKSRDNVLNIGSGNAVTLVNCAKIMKESVDAPVEIIIDEQQGYQTRYLDCTAAKTILGWQPVIDLATGIKELIAKLP